jgi:hypothetical protein
MKYPKSAFLNAFDNDNDALNAEVWAQEALMVLEQNNVLLNTVYRDFDDDVAQHGETVNAHRPALFEAERKVDGDDVTVQDASSTNVPVRLDHHLHTSFILYPKERAFSFKKLTDLYIKPAMQSLSQEADEIIAAQKYGFVANMIGKLGTNCTAQTLIDVDTKLNKLNVPRGSRYTAISPNMNGDLLAVQLFTDKSQAGPDGSALEDAMLGYKFGQSVLMSQNMYEVDAGDGGSVVSGAVNLSAGYAVGTTTLVVDGFTGQLTAGSWCKIAGDARPRRISAATGSPNTTGITLDSAIETAVVNNAVITVYPAGAINLTAGYAQYYDKRMVTDGFTAAPGRGQMVSVGATGAKYGVIGSKNTTTSLKLDRGLEAAAANNAALFAGPTGDFGMAYHKNAIAFVSRPLDMEPRPGVDQYVVSHNGLSLRVTIWYNGTKQGDLVTIDMLAGVKVLEANAGCLIVR